MYAIIYCHVKREKWRENMFGISEKGASNTSTEYDSKKSKLSSLP